MAQHQAEAFSSGKSSCRCACNGNIRQQVSQIDPGLPTQPKPRFARRNSMKANSPDEGVNCDATRRRSGSKEEHCVGDESSAISPRHPGEEGTPLKTSSLVVKSVARICGPSRSKCGYCGGKRLHVLGIKDGYNKIVSMAGENDVARAEKKSTEGVDETKTSKSYGLLFDFLPYGTYEDLINRGWRRSGKHLYRPHNFESCCPAISIRLNVLNFASRYSSQPSGPSRANGSDLAGSILVRGSKSQRKVGKAVLRAIDSYNSKCAHVQEGLSGYHSAHTSHVANIQLGDSVIDLVDSGRHNKEKAIPDPSQDGGSCESEPTHQHKKSRKRSPDRDHDKLDGDTLISKHHQSSLYVARKINEFSSAKNNVTGQKSLDGSQENLQRMLDKLSELVYQTITNEAEKIMASSYQGGTSGNGNQTEKPGWSWWDRDETDENARLPKWCSFKVSKSRGGSKGQSSANTSGVSVMISTSACAAAAGRSRRCIDKNLLVRAVVDSLRRFMLEHTQKNENKHRMTGVSCHEKSGYVHVTLDAPPSAGTVPTKPSKRAPGLMKGGLDATQGRCSQCVDKVDPIVDFMMRHETIGHKINEPHPAQNKNPHQRLILTVRSVPVHESSLQPEVHQLFCRYQTAVHGDFDPFFGISESPEVTDDANDYVFYRQKNPPGFLDIDAAYPHLDETRRSKIKTSYLTFYRFLCETPVTQGEVSSIENLPLEDGYDVHIPFGTYHQQYRLSTSEKEFDGPLIAVGVADILPHCFSSVYAFYDPILANSLELGKYTALREIEWVRRASQFRPELNYYYLGYYIHSCPKMTYKAEYKPSELLCPVKMKWVDFEDGKKRLEECSPIRHCCALFSESPSPGQELNPAKPNFKIDDIVLDIGEKEPHLVKVGMLNRQGREFVDPHVNEFVSEVGIEMCSKFVIKLR